MLPEPNRILLLEGVEGSGKSTLAADLEKLGWGNVHFGHSRASDRVGEWIQLICEAARQSADGRVVVDRMHPSCVVYEDALLGRPGISKFDWWVIDGWVTRRGGSVLYMRSKGEETTTERLERKYPGVFNLRDLNRQLESAVECSTLPKVRLVQEPDAGQITSWLTTRENVTDGSMGTGKPWAWLVGERQNRNTHPEGFRNGTAFAGGSGEWLYYALKTAGLPWSLVHVSNAIQPGGWPYDLMEKWELLERPVVVALGKVADAELSRQGVAHRAVQHPQYVRRFRTYEVWQYGQEIVTAIQEGNSDGAD